MRGSIRQLLVLGLFTLCAEEAFAGGAWPSVRSGACQWTARASDTGDARRAHQFSAALCRSLRRLRWLGRLRNAPRRFCVLAKRLFPNSRVLKELCRSLGTGLSLDRRKDVPQLSLILLQSDPSLVPEGAKVRTEAKSDARAPTARSLRKLAALGVDTPFGIATKAARSSEGKSRPAGQLEVPTRMFFSRRATALAKSNVAHTTLDNGRENDTTNTTTSTTSSTASMWATASATSSNTTTSTETTTSTTSTTVSRTETSPARITAAITAIVTATNTTTSTATSTSSWTTTGTATSSTTTESTTGTDSSSTNSRTNSTTTPTTTQSTSSSAFTTLATTTGTSTTTSWTMTSSWTTTWTNTSSSTTDTQLTLQLAQAAGRTLGQIQQAQSLTLPPTRQPSTRLTRAPAQPSRPRECGPLQPVQL
ncbi:unnamed protein product [Effrenium voratum]|uniref:Uncharacterized protein n=1 Tax=Effrenium voratum TaxID=2562239 RepID=A0AA36JHW4_9DINO|nr:unnamed protein product [Effrenium voratum]